MKTFLCIVALLGMLAIPLFAEEVKVDFAGSRLATGYTDAGAQGNSTPGQFSVVDAKLRANAKFGEDTTGVIRLDVSGGAFMDYAFIKVNNLVNKLGNFSSPVNPVITIGQFKTSFGEETVYNDPVNGALISNSVANVTGNDRGIEFKQDDLVKGLPVVLCASFALLNGCGGAETNNAKGQALKVSATFNNMPLYLSLSEYGSGKTAAAGLLVGGSAVSANRKIVELDARYDLLEGAQKFDPSKAPLFSDAKGVFRFTYGQVTDAGNSVANRLVNSYVALDAIYNINNKWYAAFRYSYVDSTWNKAVTGRDDIGKFTRISIGGGYKLSENSALKAELSQNSEPDTTLNPKIDNDTVGLVFTTLW